MKRQRKFRVLMLPALINPKLFGSQVASRIDEASLLSCEFIVEVNAVTRKARVNTEYIITLHGVGNELVYELTANELNRLGIEVRAIDYAWARVFNERKLPKYIKDQAYRIPQLLISFGIFGEGYSAELWHNAEFVDTVGTILGNALVQLFDALELNSIAFSMVHANPSTVHYREVWHKLSCQERHRCSLTSHERDLLKSIINGCYAASNKEVTVT